jgi:hypothetical protein
LRQPIKHAVGTGQRDLLHLLVAVAYLAGQKIGAEETFAPGPARTARS